MIVFGRTGQVATELQPLLPEATFLGRETVDLTNPAACFDAIMDVRPQAVINAAAYTAVDKAEDEEEIAAAVNGAAPAQMARACAEIGIPFVNISTDYVFDGSGDTAFDPDHSTGPLGAYGRSKLSGEQGVSTCGGAYVNLRTSWVFSAHGSNFVKTMLRLAETRTALTIVADQIGGPTSARAIAKACVSIVEQLGSDPSKAGTYHFSGAPDVSWADFAREIFSQAGRVVEVTDIPTSAYPTAAKRPHNSRMDCTKTKDVFGIDRPDWVSDLADVIAELRGSV